MLSMRRVVSRLDVVVAATSCLLALALFAVAPQLVGSAKAVHFPQAGHLDWWAGAILLFGQGAALLWRSTYPLQVLVMVTAAVPVGALCGMDDALGASSLAVFVAVFTAVYKTPPPAARSVLVYASALIIAGYVLNRLSLQESLASSLNTALLQTVGLIGLPLLVGMFVVARRDEQRARAEGVMALARERDAQLLAAVSHERMAMARELHDIAAHHLSGIAVMTAAIGTQIDSDPKGAKVAVAQVRAQSRTLLRDLRSLVGLLRDEQPAEPSREQTLAGITELTEDATISGMSVELTVLASPRGDDHGSGVGPLAQLAAYRIVQESLANAARHAPGARCVVVVDDRGEASVLVTVRNKAAGDVRAVDQGGGFGLVGMSERAELTGADLTYGPAPDGGWQVSLSMPRLSDPTDPADDPSQDRL